MEVVQVLRMNGGIGESSYAQNSTLQQKVISMTKPITEEAIVNLYITNFPKSLAMADLGCSSGPNTLFVVSELIKAVDRTRRKLGHESPEYQVFLNDLPGNDFNTIFRSLPNFQAKMEKQMGEGLGPIFLTGLPGSFYGRLFPRKSLHFLHSSYSLMWLSQVPEGLEDNKKNIYMATTSPPRVLTAYYEQFQKDFSLFLRCRGEELVAGGRMVLTLLGRRNDNRSSKECCYIWELLALALNEMVVEGLIEDEQLHSFNIPEYTPSASEVKHEIEREGSFNVDRLEISEISWNAWDDKIGVPDAFKDGGYNVARCMRAVSEALLVSHFKEAIIDEIFTRYRTILADRLAKENPTFVNVIVSVIRKE